MGLFVAACLWYGDMGACIWDYVVPIYSYSSSSFETSGGNCYDEWTGASLFLGSKLSELLYV